MKRQARRRGPSRRFNLTLEVADAQLLEALAQQLGEPPTKVAGDYIRKLVQGAQGPDGTVDPAQVEAILQGFRGEESHSPLEPRWEWPVEAILADARWLDRWLPDFNELMGRTLTPTSTSSGRFGERPAPIRDRRGYSDLMEFSFPAITGPRGAITWRSPEYGRLATRPGAREGDGGTVYIWESAIRHLTRALCALEELAQPNANPVMGILTQDHIAGPWLRSFRAITGEKPPTELPERQVT